MSRAAELAQKQLDAYNAQNIEEFVAQYSEDIIVMDFPSNEVTLSGKEAFRERYQTLFQNNPNQHAELKARLVKGNIVIDHEYVTGRANGVEVEAIAMYETNDDCITKVWFVK
ncbi:nuclear transport factor 2 family protein [Bacillus sp. PS06]|uniref:nuclear transport factor 2 family protein n=1 Tax=Bacillus sp. PS06 TaxID=2764176 RepID=UPI001784A0F8|nr:nuclear transport factor 2 family protein [Bacillus sp. PS06]MBD8071468.1 nuclear transport factor 2 family protein [Bacillus sp. PS06]